MPQNLYLNRDAIWDAVKTFKTRKTMDMVVEMLGNEPVPTQTLPPPSFTKVNFELAIVEANHDKVIPPPTIDVQGQEVNMEVSIVRVMVNPDHSSPADEAAKSLKRKNSQLAKEPSANPTETSSKRRRLVKESKLVSLKKGSTKQLIGQNPPLTR